jgi:hypothetical protein
VPKGTHLGDGVIESAVLMGALRMSDADVYCSSRAISGGDLHVVWTPIFLVISGRGKAVRLNPTNL